MAVIDFHFMTIHIIARHIHRVAHSLFMLCFSISLLPLCKHIIIIIIGAELFGALKGWKGN